MLSSIISWFIDPECSYFFRIKFYDCNWVFDVVMKLTGRFLKKLWWEVWSALDLGNKLVNVIPLAWLELELGRESWFCWLMPAASSVVPLCCCIRVVNTLHLLYYYYWKLLLLLLVVGRNIVNLNNTCQLASPYCCRLEQLFMNACF